MYSSLLVCVVVVVWVRIVSGELCTPAFWLNGSTLHNTTDGLYQAGYDDIPDRHYYIARTTGPNALHIPGYALTAFTSIWFILNGKSYSDQHFEYLVFPPGAFKFKRVQVHKGIVTLPQKTLKVEAMVDGMKENYFICRLYYSQFLFPGNGLFRDKQRCFTSYRGRVVQNSTFEVLVESSPVSSTTREELETTGGHPRRYLKPFAAFTQGDSKVREKDSNRDEHAAMLVVKEITRHTGVVELSEEIQSVETQSVAGGSSAGNDESTAQVALPENRETTTITTTMTTENYVSTTPQPAESIKCEEATTSTTTATTTTETPSYEESLLDEEEILHAISEISASFQEFMETGKMLLRDYRADYVNETSLNMTSEQDWLTARRAYIGIGTAALRELIRMDTRVGISLANVITYSREVHETAASKAPYLCGADIRKLIIWLPILLWSVGGVP